MGKSKDKAQTVVKSIVIIVEGTTEIEFYKLVRDHIKADKEKSLGNNFITKNYRFENPVSVDGIGNFQKDALLQFSTIRKRNDKIAEKLAKSGKNIEFEYHIFLCIDTDVFEFQQNPPLDKEKLKKDLLNMGKDVAEVSYIEAVKSIEDWFLDDLNGIKNFLKLKSIPKGYKNCSTGAKKLEHIFGQVGKKYIKGAKVEGFVENLDIRSIMAKHQKELSPLIDVISKKTP